MTECSTAQLPKATPALRESIEGIYLHIPFCVHKCPYCDFASGPAEGIQRQAYLQALLMEIGSSPWRGAAPRTLYFGGGTPSELNVSEWGCVLDALSSAFDFSKLREFTVECNPGTLSPRKLQTLRESGVNRLSLGVQSFDDGFLKTLGRIHDADCARESIQLARDNGFQNLSLDLMFGLPGQTLEQWSADLQEAIRLQPCHLSLYALTLEPGTPFFELERQNKLAPMNQDRAADMLEFCMDYCQTKGYEQYEISSFCRKAMVSRHNLLYWTNRNYLGLGVSAASHVAGFRWANARDQGRYAGGCQRGQYEMEYVEHLPARERAAEEIILRLGLDQGVDLAAISEEYDLPLVARYQREVEDLLDLGLLETRKTHLKLTRRGRLLASEVAYYFL